MASDRPSGNHPKIDKDTPIVAIPGELKVPIGVEPTTSDEIIMINSGTQKAATAIPENTEAELIAGIFAKTPFVINIDDDKIVVRAIGRVFHRRGIEKKIKFTSAITALEALKRMEEDGTLKDNGLITCDFNMPDMNGVEFAKILKASGLKDLRALTFVLATGRTGKKLEDELKECGDSVDLYIYKPNLVDTQNMRAIAETLMRNRRP